MAYAYACPPSFSDPVELKCSNFAVQILLEECAQHVEEVGRYREDRNKWHRKLKVLIGEAYRCLCKCLKETKDEDLNDSSERFQSDIERSILSLREKHQLFEEKWKDLHDQKPAVWDKFCLLYSIFWCPNEVLISTKDFNKVCVRLTGDETQSFNDACVERFQTLCEEAEGGVLCVPTVHLGPQRPKCRGRKKTALLRLPSEERNLECEAVYQVVDHLERFAKCQRLNMLILYNYEYSNYLKNIWKEVTRITGDHDVMAVCEQIGIILFQVKSCKGTLNKKLLQEAAVQLLKDKQVFFESNRDVPFVNNSFTVYSFIAVPHNIPSEIDKCICATHQSLILNSSHLESDKSFREWFLNNVPIPQKRESYPFQGEDGREYKLLCGRYVSNFSSISLPTLCEGIKKAGQEIQHFCYNLTNSQAVALGKEKPFAIVTGDFGTGKSLLLALKAQNLAKDSNCHVMLLTCSNASGFVSPSLKNTYQSFTHLQKLIGKMSNLDISSFQIIPQSKKSKVGQYFVEAIRHHLTQGHNDNVCHLFLDEVPLWLFQQCSEEMNDIVANLPDGALFWISLATQSYRVTPRGMRVVDQIKEKIPECFENSVLYLNQIMRMPKNLFLLIKEIGRYTGQGHFLDSVCGHSIPGPKPLVYTLPEHTSHNDSRQNALEGEKSVENIQKALQQIFKKIGHPKDDSDVVIIVFFFFTDTFISKLYTKLYQLLNDAVSKLPIKLRWKTLYTDSDEKTKGEDSFERDTCGEAEKRQGGQEGEDRMHTVLVVDDDSYIGCQARVVICVDPFSMFHWFPNSDGLGWDTLLLTRCLSQYVHIAWPKEEASQLWQDHLEEWERDIRARSPQVSRPELDYRLQYIAKGKSSRGECLDMLKEKALIEEIGPGL